ncbi:MAG TPA: glycosyltransferase [Xanthobacteraceae bacterium]|nr:glycosyltransferase [Xanthobacteraceae bacterium]
MDFASITPLVCAGWWALSLALLAGSTVAALIAPLRRRERGGGGPPPVSVIVPVKEASPEAASGLVSLFSQSYPDFEVLVSATETSPAIAQAQAIAARFPNIPARLIARDPHAAENPKINNLALPIAESSHDVIAIKDSNILLPPDRLTEMVSNFTGDIGLVVSVPVGAAPQNFSGAIECAAMNGYVARFLLAASTVGLGFGIGATMMFSRRDFERAGGIARIARATGEDHAISKMLAAIGRRTLIAGDVKQTIGKRRFLDFWNRQVRWAVCRRVEAPAIFYAELFVSAFFAALAGAAGAGVMGLSAGATFAGTIAVFILTDHLLAMPKGWPLSWRSPFAVLCFIALFPLIWLRARFARRVIWGGVAFTIKRSAPPEPAS